MSEGVRNAIVAFLSILTGSRVGRVISTPYLKAQGLLKQRFRGPADHPEEWDEDRRTRTVIQLRKSNVVQWAWLVGLSIVVVWALVMVSHQSSHNAHLTRALHVDVRKVTALAHANAKLGAEQKATIEATRKQALASCRRSKEVSPYLARDYARRHTLPLKVLRDYERTIPKSC